ncbi:MAG: thioredoxin domain-containing protein [Myxococcales bacterium]|nr:thioredoxin domain-containing protein [Myxococcales bacterium]
MQQLILRAGLALAIGVCACGGDKHEGRHHTSAEAPAIAPETRYRVELFPDDHGIGGDAPLVTVVLYADYACPPCARTWSVLENLGEDYGDDLRIVVRSLSAPGFAPGEEAAEAVMAAGDQGAFWALHRRFFSEPPMDRRAIEAHAKALNLDLGRLADDLDTGAFAGARLRHRRQALELGVAFGPVAFVNGRPVVGFHDEASWHALIDAEIAAAKAMSAAGTAREGLYDAITGDAPVTPIALEGEAAAARDALLAKLPPPAPEPIFGAEPTEGERFQAPLGGTVYAGPADALVVLVAYMDAGCPYCRRSMATSIPAVIERYGDDLRVEIRHLPLPIHPAAEGAARAALAAGRQGRFAEFYRELMTGDDRKLSRSRFSALAESLGLDLQRFLSDLDDPEIVAAVREDQAAALKVGIQATPSFFVNGRFYSGHRGVESLTEILEQEMATSAAKVAAGTPRAEVAASIIASGRPLEAAAQAPASPSNSPKNPDRGAEQADSGPAPDAAITDDKEQDLKELGRNSGPN